MSRNKGSAAEREVARLLEDELGIKFARDLEQCRSGGSDLVPSDPAFPFVIEVKRRAKGGGYDQRWWTQAVVAASEARKHVALIYRFDRQPWRCVVSSQSIYDAAGLRGDIPLLITEMSLSYFCLLAREIMARRSA